MRWADRVMRSAVNHQHFPTLRNLQSFAARESLWDMMLEQYVGLDVPITYVEFGVWKGDSIRYMAGRNLHPDSVFVGLDTFDGLDDEWINISMKDFSVGGQAPDLDDDRITFIKGMFQDTAASLVEAIQGRDNYLVHFDADLYSSTLFALTQLDAHLDSYHAIFDEFHAGENLALHHYQESYLARTELLGRTDDEAMRVGAKIVTSSGTERQPS